MSLTILDDSDRVPARRGEVIVVVPVYNAYDEFVACVRSLLAHTSPDVSLLICDDASPDARARDFLEQLDAAGALQHAVHLVRHAHNGGFVENVNDAFARVAPADVVVVNSDCVVTDGWLPALRRAAYSSTLVASASALTNHGTILSLPHRNRPVRDLPQTTTVDRAARDIASGSLRLYPQIPTIVGHCFYVKRLALDLVGDFDLAFSPGYGEEVDFSQRCVLRGLAHVAADDAFVLHKGSASFSPDQTETPAQEAHHRIILSRYPYYDEWVCDVARDESGPFPRAIRSAQRALRGLSVTIDGRCLTAIATGTQVYTLQLVSALVETGAVRVRVLVPPDLGEYARPTLRDLELITEEDVARGVEPSDVAHRPYQVSSHNDLELLAQTGHRIVVTHLDLIAYGNPGYFASYEQWAGHRQLTHHALGLADGVVFISRTAADHAIAEDLVRRERSHVVHLGTDHAVALEAAERPPGEIASLGERPFLLCLGTDFMHKNRVFALRLLHALREQHQWEGAIVFAGPRVAAGSSAADEAAFLALHPDLAASVVDVAAVDEGEKRWLVRSAAAVVYPSVHEGFGFIPFEAAEVDTACAFAAQTSTAELLPQSLALIEQWDPQLTADRLIDVLRSPELRAEHVRAVRAAAAPLTWHRTGAQLLDVYRQVSQGPTREARRLAAGFAEERRLLERRIVEYERLLDRVEPPVDDVALGLLGPDGVPPDLRRPLLAITSRPLLRRPLFGVLRLIYRFGYRLLHGRRRPAL